jgi:glycosyltransferase involved in cell wall biosynthesis
MNLEARGCVYHKSRDWASLEGLDCISYCNAEFLTALPEIKKYARSTTFVNCMTWNFDAEVEMQGRNLIDFHLYQTRHGFDRISPKLKGEGCYRPLFYKPYFHTADFPYVEKRPTDAFRFGRISRPDPAKFHESQLWIYATMTAPVPKAGLIMGWSPEVQRKLCQQPDPYIAAVNPGWTSAREFYRFCDVIIMTTDTFENLPRVGFEAMASGSVLVVDDRPGWRLLVDTGVTGWLCADQREFVYRATRLAYESTERDQLRGAARSKLENEWGEKAAAEEWEQVFKAWQRLK